MSGAPIPPDEAEFYRLHDERKRRPCTTHHACDCLHARLEAWRPIIAAAIAWHDGGHREDLAKTHRAERLYDAVRDMPMALRP